MIFGDTSGWFALFIPSDPDHRAAYDWVDANAIPLITTDYAIDETLTLMRARGQHRKALDFGLDIFGGGLALIHYATPADIVAAWDVFARYADKDWSFTDCTSKVVMEVSITTAFSFDHHFRQFGTVVVVP